ncbi:MAG: histidine phosphatase family protein [Alphaproteobacteria bacterium]|nr:histidine phosphatase family protein [Alphaproteobacteria bacterium]
MKTLYLLRHAKSSWENTGIDDYDRPLNARGQRAAMVMGVYFAQQQLRPDLILCSSARRTLETLDQVRPRIPGKPQLSIEKELYLASANDLMKRLRKVDPAVGSILLLGHNPGLEDLARLLFGKQKTEVVDGLNAKYPTGGLATFAADIDSWKDLKAGGASLQSFVIPKGLV